MPKNMTIKETKQKFDAIYNFLLEKNLLKSILLLEGVIQEGKNSEILEDCKNMTKEYLGLLV